MMGFLVVAWSKSDFCLEIHRAVFTSGVVSTKLVTALNVSLPFGDVAADHKVWAHGKLAATGTEAV